MQGFLDPALRGDGGKVDDLVERMAACMRGQDYAVLDALAEEALEAARASDDDALFAVAAECRAQAEYHLGRYPVALRAFGDAIERWHDIGDAVAEARSRLGHSSLLATCGLTSESLEEAHAVLALVDESADFPLWLGAMLTIGRVQTVLRAWDEAGRLYARALAAARARGDDPEIGRVLVDLGYFYCERSRESRLMGDRPALRDYATRSRACNREAAAFCRSKGWSKLEWVATLNLGESQMDLGQLDDARATTEEVLERIRSATPPSAHFEGEALLNIGQISLAGKAFELATKALTRALEIARQQGMNELVMKSCELLTLAHEGRQDFRAALDHHRKFFAAHGEILSEGARLRASLSAVHFETIEARAAFAAERERSKSLVLDNLELQRESLEDSLTGLPNHRAFRRDFDRFVVDHARGDNAFFLALIDVDDFKAINDGHSHTTGDDVLKALATVLRSACRQGDLVARYGGEEFTLLLPARTRVNALSACERIRDAIESHPWSTVKAGLRVTASLGVVGSDECADEATMFEIADRRLYASKDAGKNRVVASDR